MESPGDNDLIQGSELERAAGVFQSLNHEVRLRIMELLHKNKKMTVRSIYGKLGLEQSLVSHHLAILRKCGLVKTGKFKNYIIYSVDHKRLAEIHFYAGRILELEGRAAKILPHRSYVCGVAVKEKWFLK